MDLSARNRHAAIQSFVSARPFPAPCSTPTNAASKTATSTIEELPLDCHMTCSAMRERICTHRTFTLGSTDSPGFNNSSALNS